MNRTLRRILAAAALAGVAVVLLACARFLGTSRTVVRLRDPGGPRIDHAAHLDKGLECADCHGKEPEPQAPKYEACADCHDDEDAEKPAEKKIKNLFFRPDGSPAWIKAALAYDPEIRFAHPKHVAATKCETCHGELQGRERRAGMLFTMEQCMGCHAQKAAPNDCSVCHTYYTVETPPASHRHLWKQRHGHFLRTSGPRAEQRCDLCHHEPSFCDTCHKSEPPANHTNLFRTRSHGILAAIDRKACQVCHDTDFCVRCHESTAPRSHGPSWLTRHCLQCHFPIAREPQCNICHQEEPQHETAPPMPPAPFHVPGANCRLCHLGGGAPDPGHPDPGIQCEFCHK